MIASAPTSAGHRFRIVTRAGGLVASTVLVALLLGFAAPVGAAVSEPPKKVGTERIVVDPKPAGETPPPQTPLPQTPLPHAPGATAPAAAEGPPVETHRGVEGLPPAVAKMRQRLLDAAYSGDLQKLRIAIQSNEMPPVFSINEIGDPIEYLKTQSGDGQGLELLAILTDVLESSWTRTKPGTPQEMYVWPAYSVMALDKLEPGQLVELYKIVTSSDLEEMKGAGRYTFYTVGIGPDGTWHWFKLAD